MIRQYEILFIVKPHLSEEESKKVLDTFQSWITKSEGAIKSIKEIGLRELATEFKKYKKGYYVQCHFEGTPKTLETLNGYIRISEDIIRYLTLKLDEVVEPVSKEKVKEAVKG